MALHKAFKMPKDANNNAMALAPHAYGGQIASADTNVNQLIPIAETNAGTWTDDTFQLTDKNCTNISFANYVLEITQSGYEQEVVIISNTSANPGVATVRSLHKGARKGDGDVWFPSLPSAGSLTYRVKPIVYSRVHIAVHATMVGTLTILRGATNNADSTLAILENSVNTEQDFFVDDITKLYYKFSVGTGSPEAFRWCCS